MHDAVSRHVWETKYRHRSDRTIEGTWRRVAKALSEVEPAAEPRPAWEERFYSVLEGFRFLPGGRILAGAGTRRRVTLFNCFVMGRIEDSLDGIFEALKEGALTMQQGGGVGYDFSTLRPAGTPAVSAGTIASGPVSFLRVWDSMCATVLSTGARRGAMMATLRCDHPDVEAFVDAKREPGALTNFNLSVQVTDAFLDAVHKGEDWPLVFSGHVFRSVPARPLWDRILRAAWEHAEPGVLFVDRINRLNNLWYREHLTATNPCGEVPLPPYGACDLGSLNLVRFVQAPFSPDARLDLDALRETAAVAVRMLDDVIDASRFPLPQQERQARATRRIGLGLTGLADALAMLGHRYDSPGGLAAATEAMRTICHAAYRASIDLAREKGSFPALDREKHVQGEFIRSLPDDIREGIAAHGIRNSHLTAIAPTGTISLLAGNVSSGIEPIFGLRHRRRLLDADGSWREVELADPALVLWRELHPGAEPPAGLFATARELPPAAHLDMQAALQPFVDSAISKTINVPADLSFTRFRDVYEEAWRKGLKGVTAFRPNPVTGDVLSELPAPAHCCTAEREAD
ncbi:MAG TPA: adenosylcobalamin-dependent ribonucleoside-diphosphate reductase [Thermoanaerobaculia bacterium]